ncbi:ATP-binding protein [Telmatospirillum siberiense]|uniref:histidine kinase n=1 Tax=Telmatospirillum siberiense TaxID=382514 RepID=A0A2N3Q1L5_9PROT|nr:ATP-binding protein [Telmatospirillum siberiense]PKU26544.1 hypothetical protein CWS72_01500 [Telmatospirillum siberiense]
MSTSSIHGKSPSLRHRLSTRHAFFTVIIALLVGFGVSFVEFFLNLREERARSEEAIRLVLDMVTEPAASAAYTIDKTLAQRIVSKLINDHEILSAEIRDDFGGILGQAKRSPADQNLTNISNYLVTPIPPFQIALFNDNYVGEPIHVGELMVAIDSGAILDNLENGFSRMALSSMIRAVAIATIMAMLFHVLTTKPLLRLAGSVAEIEPSQPIRQMLTVPQGHAEDELGMIAEAVNRLITAFQKSLAEQDRIGEELRQLAASLERRVEERTAELAKTNENLRLAMDHLVNAEKLAALGQLVAGVAHELNTPLGNILTVATTLRTRAETFAERIRSGSIQRSVLDNFVAENLEATRILIRGAESAAGMIGNFKQVAVDQGSFGQRRFQLAAIVQEMLSSLHNKLKNTGISVKIDIPDDILLDNHPGPIEQILINFITNSILHAFDAEHTGTITITARAEDGDLTLTYQDDGKGMSEETARRAFDPFFTTKFGQGGSGLGLYIVYNLVTGALNGNLRMSSHPGAGTRFDLSFPLDAIKKPNQSGEKT